MVVFDDEGKSFVHPHKLIYKSVAETLHPHEHFTYNDPKYSVADGGNYKNRIDAIFNKVRHDKDVSLIVEAMPTGFRNPYNHAAYQYIVDNQSLELRSDLHGNHPEGGFHSEEVRVVGQPNEASQGNPATVVHSRITSYPPGSDHRAILEIPLQENRMEPGRSE